MKIKNKHLMGSEEIEAIKDLIETGSLFRYRNEEGQCDLFEKEFSNKMGFHYSLLLTSGTNALVCALGSLGIGPGDEVIIPSYTYVATASAVLTVGAIPIVCNIDQSLMMDPQEAKKLINEKTKAIIPVHMDGMQADIKTFSEICQEYNLHLIEDTAQALGAKLHGKPLGSFGDFGCFSLNRDKTLSCGEGGIVSCQKRDLYEKSLCLSDHGYSFNLLHQDHFQETTPTLGLSMRVSEISGAIMRVQLKKLKEIIQLQKERKQILTDCLKDLPNIQIIEAKDPEGECGGSFHLICENPKLAATYSKDLMEKGIPMIPIPMRKAHCVWKWEHMLKEEKWFNPKLSSYQYTEKKNLYHKFNFLPSIEILSKTLRLEIDITKDLEETKSLAQTIKEVLS